MSLEYCPICGNDLGTSQRVQRWTHDIIKHRSYWEEQTVNMTKDQLMKNLYEIIEYYQGVKIEH